MPKMGALQQLGQEAEALRLVLEVRGSEAGGGHHLHCGLCVWAASCGELKG